MGKSNRNGHTIFCRRRGSVEFSIRETAIPVAKDAHRRIETNLREKDRHRLVTSSASNDMISTLAITMPFTNHVVPYKSASSVTALVSTSIKPAPRKKQVHEKLLCP